MASRWEVERALMWSNIRPMGRFIMLAIATKADVSTGVVADEHTPSLRTLSAMTGLAKSVLPGHLTYLGNLGWLKVDIAPRASRYDRNRYTIMVGSADPTRPSGPAPGPLDESGLVGSGPDDGPLGADRETDTSDAAETATAAPEQEATEPQRSATQTASDQEEDLFGNASGPSHGPATTKSKPKTERTTRKPPAASSSSSDPPNPTAQTLLAGWIDYCRKGTVKKLPQQTIGRYAAVIRDALADGFSADEIEAALVLMYARKATSHPSQLPAFLVEIQTGPREWASNGSANTYRNSPNPDDVDDWKRK